MTRDEAIAWLTEEKKARTILETESHITQALGMALDALKAEAVRVEIVSCKDCKHWREWENGTGHCGRSENPHFWFGSDADDFCSFGERREP